MNKLYAWFQRKVTDPFWSYLKQGATPIKLSRSASVGFSIGICPLIGISTGLCVLILLVSRSFFHGPMMLLANFVALPVNVSTRPPYTTFPGHMFNGITPFTDNAEHYEGHHMLEQSARVMQLQGIQVALIVPFMRLGEVALREKHLPLSPVSLKDIIFNHPGDALRGLGHAVLGWAITLVFIIAGLTVILKPVLTLLQKSLYKRAVDLEAGGPGVGLLEDDSASASSISEELSIRRSSSASPGLSEGNRTRWGQVNGVT